MTPELHKSFRRWLDKEILLAQENMEDTCNTKHNSFACGFDQGFLHGLKFIKGYFTGE